MKTSALFIGINEYADPGVRNLNGARWDAVALHALFRDALCDVHAVLLADRDATLARVNQELEGLLDEAEADDTVVITFSGHGTRDHRLVVHDTEKARLTETTIGTELLATAFKRCRARAIIIVLDCCFSGGAPARVLEDSPTSRDLGNPLEQIAGRGRILIAASRHDEPAWERGGKGHGLLTAALIEVLGRGDAPRDVVVSMAEVLESVRAEAARLGRSQTPVLLGLVEGGLVLPVLRPGSHYAAAFPERRGLTISSRIDDLAGFGFPPPVLAIWSSSYPGGLNELQLGAINGHRVLDGKSLLVVAPTGAGKTLIGELATIRAVSDARRAAFLLPYRALVNEKYDDFSARYSSDLGLRVIRCTGDYTDQAGALINGKYEIALLTYEMFLNLAVTAPAVLSHLGLVVVDEAQFLTDPHRGIAVELLLTLLLTAGEAGCRPQVIALSAVIGNENGFPGWLRAGFLRTEKRPVPLVEGVLDRTGQFQFRDADGTTRVQQLVPSASIRVRREKPSAQDLIVPLVRSLVGQGDETVIVFRNMRGPAEGCARYLANDLGLPSAASALAALPQHDLSSASAALRACLSHGTAFHTSNLNRDERQIVERAFRSTGEVRVMAATTTLAAGINTPASTVILAEQEFVGEDGRPFTIAEYKNMAGRAGRPGYPRPGCAIILAENPLERDQLFRRYVLGEPEDMHSSFQARQLDTWVLRLLAQVRRLPEGEVVRLLANTYGGYLATRRDPGWGVRIQEDLGRLLSRMLSLDLLEQEGEHIQLTLLGAACGRSSLRFESCMRLVELLRQTSPGEIGADGLMVLLQVLPESDDVYTPLMSKAHVERGRPQELARAIGDGLVRNLQRFAQEGDVYLRRCKRVLILRDWTSGLALDEIERRFSPSPYGGKVGYGDVRRFADAARFHLRSAQQIAQVMFPSGGPTAEDIEAVLRQLEIGVPRDSLPLLDVPLDWTRGELLALRAIGIVTPDQLWGRSADELRSVLGDVRNAKLARLRVAADAFSRGSEVLVRTSPAC